MTRPIPEAEDPFGDDLPAGWVDIATVAATLGVSKMTAYRRVHSGDIPAIQLDGPGSLIRIRERSLNDFVRTKAVHVCRCDHPEV